MDDILCLLGDLEELYQSQLQHSNKKELNFHLKSLKDELMVLRKGIFGSDDNLEAKYDIVKEFITTFIKNSLESSPESEVYDQLHKLCYEEMLIPSKLYTWTFKSFNEISQLKKVSPSMELLSKFPLSGEQILNRSLSVHEVNNCLLLCKIVSECNSTNYTRFLSKRNHSFDEVSFSIPPPKHLKSELEVYVIAKNESKKEIYVGFLGEPDISVWKEKYSTFEEGNKLLMQKLFSVNL